MIYSVILGYNTAEMVEAAMKNFAETVEMTPEIKKILFIYGFPLPSPEENIQALSELAVKHGWESQGFSNQGVMENWNFAIHEVIQPKEGDFIVCFDPDVRMQQKGWLPAMIEALQSDSRAVFCCAARPYHDEAWCSEQHGRQIFKLPSGLRIARYRELLAWSMGVWKGEWLALRPRDFKASNPIYGYAEHADVARIHQYGKSWISLVDFYDHHASDDCDPRYTEWKQACAGKVTDRTFDDWLLIRSLLDKSPSQSLPS